MPVDTELYELLGLSSNANEGERSCLSARDDALMPVLTDEIKKAYRKKVDIFRVSYNIIITHDFTGQGAPPCK